MDKTSKEKVCGFLEKNGLEGVKLVGELLVNGDDLVDDNGTITYVGTTYDASKIGSIGSMIVFDAIGLNNKKTFNISDEQSKNVIDFICSNISDSKFQILDINKFA